MWILPQTEWIELQFSTVTNSGNGRFYLKGVQLLHKSSHAQIMEFSNWDKCAFKNFFFLFWAFISGNTCGSCYIALNCGADKENLKGKKN